MKPRNSGVCFIIAAVAILILKSLDTIRVELLNWNSRSENLFTRRTDERQRSDSGLAIARKALNTTTRPTALVWTKYYSRWLSLDDGKVVITSDRRAFDNVSMVFFHFRDIDARSLPIHKPAHQRWVLFGWESPYYTYCRRPLRRCHRMARVAVLLSRIDLVMSYTADADIYAPYLRVAPKAALSEYHFTPDAFARKRRSAAILVSHCEPHSQRHLYIRELQRHLDVYVYGRCAGGKRLHMTTEAVFDYFQRNYKFYLAFENSICPDYVTEKAFNALSTDIVPVVLGGANYQRMLPPHSYVDALRFESPRELARHLHTVGRNFSTYSAFLQWKRRFRVEGEKAGSRAGAEYVLSMIAQTLVTPPSRRPPADIRRRVSAFTNRSLCQPWQALLNTSSS